MSDRFLTRQIGIRAFFCDGTDSSIEALIKWFKGHGWSASCELSDPLLSDYPEWSPSIMVDNSRYWGVREPLWWAIQPGIDGYKAHSYDVVESYDDNTFSRLFVTAGGAQ
tara:strand:+ start:50 stop:379 length:330 start_codon:yes stop_codon:yes gene_type:complete